MPIRNLFKYDGLTLILWLLFSSFSLVAQADGHADQHGDHWFHAFRLELDYGHGHDHPMSSWDFDGWIGGDKHRLALKSEGELEDGDLEQAEFWILYSRNIARFWDLQAGLRVDTQAENIEYLALGFEGLAPYFFETEVHLLISDDGDLSLRFRQENELLISQRLILQAYLEADLYAQDVEELELAAGLTDAELGLQLRYELHRKFAPYLDLVYERKFGHTATLAQQHGEERADFIISVGLRLLF